MSEPANDEQPALPGTHRVDLDVLEQRVAALTQEVGELEASLDGSRDDAGAVPRSPQR